MVGAGALGLWEAEGPGLVHLGEDMPGGEPSSSQMLKSLT